jgi:cytochrome c oxidase subunit II
VFAEPPARFRAWLAAQARPRRAPATPLERRGEQVFMHSQCESCHTMRGTPARGTVGPDLTHVGGRTTLASLTIPNTPRELTAWLTNPQRVKPGNRMPTLPLTPADRQALVAYLESLR